MYLCWLLLIDVWVRSAWWTPSFLSFVWVHAHVGQQFSSQNSTTSYATIQSFYRSAYASLCVYAVPCLVSIPGRSSWELPVWPPKYLFCRFSDLPFLTVSMTTSVFDCVCFWAFLWRSLARILKVFNIFRLHIRCGNAWHYRSSLNITQSNTASNLWDMAEKPCFVRKPKNAIQPILFREKIEK